MYSISEHFKKYTLVVTTLLAISAPLIANAQHADIWLELNGSQATAAPINIETMSPVLVDFTTDKFLFTGDFDDIGQGPNATDDPGFQAEAGTFNSGAILNFRTLDSLQFWNGSAWVNTTVDQERIQIEDALSSITTLSASGVTNAEGAIDQVAGDGSIHQHVDFSIDNSAGSGVAAPGMYMFELEFYLTDGVGGPIIHTASDPVRIALNFQLSASEASQAINQLTQPAAVSVPIPGMLLVLLAGLLIAISNITRSLNSRICKSS